MPSDQPESIGRYRVARILGEGGFGRVYLAHDKELDRAVAIKVPHANRIAKAEDVDAYLAEARILASLDHPNIVPVHDVGRTEGGLCYVVSKFVQGSDLADKIKRDRPSFAESAEIVAVIASALQHAHERGLIHRDVKPANILIGEDGKPYLADFGLALKDEDFGKGAKRAGTPAYMSPEQARGEGHRVDGRSDVFSLGVVFYELLSGKRPFRADSRDQLLEQISTVDVRPPRQLDGSIPRELDRIALKALAKRATDRYGSARDLNEDLQHFLDSLTDAEKSELSVKATVTPTPTITPMPPTPFPFTPDSDRKPVKIVPKGLRSFDASDANFFLELLPGPRVRDGLPDSIRFWKTRMEETDPDETFSVGLIYGPSGEGLVDMLASLRRGRSNRKVIIFIDQFEQWLHAKRHEEDSELVQALRHCDGGNLQCIVMVRDDFWLAVSRFMRELEIRLVDAVNSALVDLFDERHARKVLAAFGRAFGVLADNAMADDQKQFVDQSVTGLADDGKVVCVRLSLFAEMVKGKPWTPTTLKEVGGTEGVGVTFLEETFSAKTAPPEHRLHQKAARAMLKALLPDGGTDIKGHMKSEAELKDTSGYASRQRDFGDLIHILDSELRLITPTDPEGVDEENDQPQVDSTDRYYQLTHDYLVPSLRQWLTQKQKETRRGRAELRLVERSSLWNVKPEDRHLPSLWEYGGIRLLTDKTTWSEPQRNMMRKAGRLLGVRWTTALAVLLIAGIVIQQYVAAIRHRNLVERVQTTVASMRVSRGILVPRAIADLRELPNAMILEELKARFDDSKPSEKLSLAYALADYGQGDLEFLLTAIADAPFAECANFVTALKHDKDQVLRRLSELATESDAKSDWEGKVVRKGVRYRYGDLGSFLGLPRARRIDSSPRRRTVFVTQDSSPKSRLLEIDRCIAFCSLSVSGAATKSLHLAPRGIGHAARATFPPSLRAPTVPMQPSTQN